MKKTHLAPMGPYSCSRDTVRDECCGSCNPGRDVIEGGCVSAGMRTRGVPAGLTWLTAQLLSCLMLPTVVGAESWGLQRDWGDKGKGDGQFNAVVMGLALDASGHLYVGDHGWASASDVVMRVQKFDAYGNFLGALGSRGSEPGQFAGVWDVTVGSNGNVFVADYADPNRRVQELTPDGSFVRAFPSKVAEPMGVAVDLHGFVYVTEGNVGLVIKYTPEGEEIKRWTASGTIHDPEVDSAGFLYVAGVTSGTILKYTSEGDLVREFAAAPAGQLTGIAVDGSGNIWAALRHGNAVRKFANDGTPIEVSFDRAFSEPFDVEVSRDGRTLYVAQCCQAPYLQKFVRCGDAMELRVDGREHVVGYPSGKGVRVPLPQPGSYTVTLKASNFKFGVAGPESPHVVGFIPASSEPAKQLFTLNRLGASKTLNAEHEMLLFFVDYDGSIDDNSGGSTVEVSKDGVLLGSYPVDGKANAVGFKDTRAQHVWLCEPGLHTVALRSSDFRFGWTGSVSALVLGFCPTCATPGGEVFSLNGIGASRLLSTSQGADVFFFFIDHEPGSEDNLGGSVVSIGQGLSVAIAVESVAVSWPTLPGRK